MKKTLIALLSLSALLLSACGTSAPAASSGAAAESTPASSTAATDAAPSKVYTVKHNISPPETDAYAQMATKWGEEIVKATNGGITVENYYNNALGENDDVVEQALSGAPIMAGTDPSRLASYVKEFGVIQMPYIFEDYTAINKVVETPSYASWVEKLRQNGLQLVAGNWFSGTRNVFTNKEVRTPDDLKGLRLRTIGNDICTKSVNAMGAVATPMPFAEVYQAIQLKGLEGTEMQTVAIESSRMFEVCKVLSKTQHFQLIACEVMGADFFDTLPVEYQQALISTGKAMGKEQQQMLVEKSASFEKEMVEKYGCTIVEIEDLTPFIEATKPVYEELGFVEVRDQLFKEMEAIA